MSYTKLAKSILTSTLWMENDHTRICWLAMLAMADKNGEVQASIPGLANIARIPVESARAAIARFQQPDPDSRTKDDEGRRIQEIKGGWLLINHAEYRNLASDEDRKIKAAERQKRFRDRVTRNAGVTPSNAESHQNPQAKADTNADADAVTPLTPVPGELALEADEKPKAPKPTDVAKEAIGKLFNRRSKTPWSEKEMAALQTVCKMGLAGEAELELMRWYYEESGCQFLRTNVQILLNNWTGELDRARAARERGGVPTGDAGIEALKNRIAYHPANREWVGYVASEVTEEQRADWEKLKAQLAGAGRASR